MASGMPDFMPDEFGEWAEAHHELLEHVVRTLQTTGQWPLLSDLTRDFVRVGKPTRVEAIFAEMPPALRYRTGHPERAVLSLLGLRTLAAGMPLLDGFYNVLSLARKRYAADDRPVLSSTDIGQLAEQSGANSEALIEIVDREASFLGSSAPESSPETWVREISTRVVDYWDATTIDDALRVRADEVRRSPTTHWPAPPIEASGLAVAQTPVEPEHAVFISHASEDKAEIARPIAQGLAGLGWEVWLDQYELTVGDSLFDGLNQGLAKSRCGVVILSESFFDKHWPKRELEALAAKEATLGGKVILPVWHGIDQHYLAEHAPMLADRLGVSTRSGIQHVVDELARALVKELGSVAMDPNPGPLFRSAVSDGHTSQRPLAQPDLSTGSGPVLVLAPSFRHRLNDPHQVTGPPQVIWSQSALVDVENVGSAVAFIKHSGADTLGVGAINVKPPTAIAPGTTRSVELVVSTITADAHVAAGELFRFWVDYGGGDAPDQRLWASTKYDGGGRWTNVGSENRPL